MPRYLGIVSLQGTTIEFEVEQDYHPSLTPDSGPFAVDRADGGTSWINFDNCIAIGTYERAKPEHNGRTHLRVVQDPEDVA